MLCLWDIKKKQKKKKKFTPKAFTDTGVQIPLLPVLSCFAPITLEICHQQPTQAVCSNKDLPSTHNTGSCLHVGMYREEVCVHIQYKPHQSYTKESPHKRRKLPPLAHSCTARSWFAPAGTGHCTYFSLKKETQNDIKAKNKTGRDVKYMVDGGIRSF